MGLTVGNGWVHDKVAGSRAVGRHTRFWSSWGRISWGAKRANRKWRPLEASNWPLVTHFWLHLTTLPKQFKQELMGAVLIQTVTGAFNDFYLVGVGRGMLWYMSGGWGWLTWLVLSLSLVVLRIKLWSFRLGSKCQWVISQPSFSFSFSIFHISGQGFLFRILANIFVWEARVRFWSFTDLCVNSDYTASQVWSQANYMKRK